MSGYPGLLWRIMQSRYRGRFVSIGEVLVLSDVFQRSLGRGFARVWQVIRTVCAIDPGGSRPLESANVRCGVWEPGIVCPLVGTPSCYSL